MPKLVFWLDVDNTLVANDDVKEDLDQHLQVEVGTQLAERFWALYEEVRKEESLVDIPLALERFREQTSTAEMDDLTYQHVRSIFNNYPFSKALYPYALETVQHLNTLGTAVIVSDGDPIFQSEKIISSNLAEAVEGRVLLYVHKQDHVQETMKAYPGDHYAAVDDKPDILLDTKNLLGDRVTTVFVRQGKYAKQLPEHFSADITVDHIGDLRSYSAEQFLKTAKK
jgi:phosphoserine phosphatase